MCFKRFFLKCREYAYSYRQRGGDLVTLEMIEEKRGNLGTGLKRKEEMGLKKSWRDWSSKREWNSVILILYRKSEEYVMMQAYFQLERWIDAGTFHQGPHGNQ